MRHVQGMVFTSSDAASVTRRTTARDASSQMNARRTASAGSAGSALTSPQWSRPANSATAHTASTARDVTRVSNTNFEDDVSLSMDI